tara:strand:+ start:1 stop:1434 length:1434 start_codon:yes stop_codon:yes gene_type:complete
MVFPVVGGDGKPTGYDIDNSLRFDYASNAKLAQTFSSAGNRRTWTWSGWIKRAKLATRQTIFSQSNTTDNNQWVEMRFEDSDALTFSWYSQGVFVTKLLFRDPSAWYHIVLALDTTDGTSGNRVKLYINGNQIADNSDNFAGGMTIPSQNYDTGMNQDSAHHIGDLAHNGNFNSGYYITEVHSIDGTQKQATDFGEFNDNGVWIPKKYDGTYGTNGYYLQFQQTGTSANSSGIGADTSGNDRHFTPTNLAATDITTDTCTNNFATLNPLHNFQNDPTYSEGNTKVVFADGGNGASPLSTFAVNSGKFYFEAKFVQTSDPGHGAIAVGIVDADQYNVNGNADEFFDRFSYGFSYNTDGQKKTNNSGSSYGSVFDSGDIIGVAVDFDNRQIYFSKNGTFQNSGDPTSGATGTGSAFNFASATYYFAVYAYQDENSWEVNFGNAPFSISSGNSDGKYGNFEYAPPSGYYALCTKRLAEFG